MQDEDDDDPANNSYEFASSRRVDVDVDADAEPGPSESFHVDNSKARALQRNNNNDEKTPRSVAANGYGSKTKRRQNSAPSHRRKSVPQAAQGDTSTSAATGGVHVHDKRGRIASADPRRAAAQCTRQTGCTCAQCSADASFQSMLRSEYTPSSGPQGTKPEWNR